LFGNPRDEKLRRVIGRGSQVIYDIGCLRRHWGRILNVLSVTPEAYGKQTAILLEK
jgi:hypothetical protein